MALQSYAVFPDLLKQMIGCPWIGAADWLGVGAALEIWVTVVVTGLKCWGFVGRRIAIASNAMQRMYSNEESNNEDVFY
ncbi:hypothetical protein Aduo_001047 [Ancylostoma duodenale]